MNSAGPIDDAVPADGSRSLTFTVAAPQAFLFQVVARRRGASVADLLRDCAAAQIAANLSARDQEKILSLLAPRNS